MDKFITEYGADDPSSCAQMFAIRGDRDRAFQFLDKALARRDPGPWVGHVSLEPLPASGIEQGRLYVARENLIHGDDIGAIFSRLEFGLARRGLATLGRPPFRDPFLKTSVEYRDPTGAKMTKHEPGARRSADRTIIVDDDPVVAANSDPGAKAKAVTHVS